MSTYSEVLSQAQSLTPDEQQQLLEVLKRWRGFLPYRVDALEFQLQLRAEWDE
ncbi:hypothetical protein [Microcoleus sp. PH2017_05_CCC_O_A]|uniref:hypothetical protein n=1 Tax=Microcoleus sp. PH2017_05_CCC_O_A TaxID=2798816 RepID=UPI001DEF9585|nr:hypothetical protein [Microcoleus sp. PH2017_05_CCC_O_A]MCC3436735.1 hypothetical protein [Microcoleus sp. PH2017_05_CCC_O_A]